MRNFMDIFRYIRNGVPDDDILDYFQLTAEQLEGFKGIWKAILAPIYKRGLRGTGEFGDNGYAAESYLEGWIFGALYFLFQEETLGLAYPTHRRGF
jgi:hypothetical protein